MARKRFHGLKKIVRSIRPFARSLNTDMPSSDFVSHSPSTICIISRVSNPREQTIEPSSNRNGRPKPTHEVIMERPFGRSSGPECFREAFVQSYRWTTTISRSMMARSKQKDEVVAQTSAYGTSQSRSPRFPS